MTSRRLQLHPNKIMHVIFDCSRVTVCNVQAHCHCQQDQFGWLVICRRTAWRRLPLAHPCRYTDWKKVLTSTTLLLLNRSLQPFCLKVLQYSQRRSQALEKSEGAPGTHCLCMRGSPGFSGEIGNSRKIYSVTLTSLCQMISPVWKMPAIDHAPSKR